MAKVKEYGLSVEYGRSPFMDPRIKELKALRDKVLDHQAYQSFLCLDHDMGFHADPRRDCPACYPSLYPESKPEYCSECGRKYDDAD